MAEQVYTTGQVAKFCRVAPRTVSKWFDSGKLLGYRIPGGQDRRVMRSILVNFMQEYGLPTDLLPCGVGGGGRVLAVGLGRLADVFDGVSAVGGELTVVRADDLFDAGFSLSAELPNVIVADPQVVGVTFVARMRRVVGCARVPCVGVLPDDTANDELTHAVEKLGYTVAVRRSDVGELVSLVSGWRKLEGGHRKPKAGVRAEKAGRRSTAAV